MQVVRDDEGRAHLVAGGLRVGDVDDAGVRLALDDQSEGGPHVAGLDDAILDLVPHAGLLQRLPGVAAGRHGGAAQRQLPHARLRKVGQCAHP